MGHASDSGEIHQGVGTAVPPARPTPRSERIAALRRIEALQGLSDDEYCWLASHATERIADGQAVIVRQGEPSHHLHIILKGEIHVHRRNLGSVTLFVGRTGQITGKLPYSRMVAWTGEGVSSGYLWVLDIHEDEFPAMLMAIPSMAQRCVSVMLDRVRDFTRAYQQAEKLAALGNLAASLSHELNNPASAAQRAAQNLASTIDRDQELCSLGRMFASEEELSNYLAWTRRSLATIQAGTTVNSMDVSESDREEEFIEWMEAHQVPNAWSVAPAFARTNLPLDSLDQLGAAITSDALPAAVASFAASLNARNLVDTVADSSARIFRVVGAIRDYSYMDQAPIQEVDLAHSLENSLAVLGTRLQEMIVARDYDPALPAITAYGGELSQVWTSLIENAIDATQGNRDCQVDDSIKRGICVCRDLG